jgi:peptidoglycan hydrolase-like protein with peptidoglycan-binding domain
MFHKAASIALIIGLLPFAAAQAETSGASDNKELARALQRQLKRLGCFDGDANGVWGDKSRAAFKSFVRQAKLNVDGDDPNVSVLDAASTVKMRVCAVAASGTDKAEESPRQARHEPTKATEVVEEPKVKEAKEPKRVQRIEKVEQPVRQKQAREARIEREPRVQHEPRVQREARVQREPREARESSNSGKRLCFGAARNELVTCP